QDRTINYPASAALAIGVMGDETLFVNWYQGGAGDTSHLVGNGTSITVTPFATHTYWARTGTSCRSFDSQQVTITVVGCNDPFITQQPLSQTIIRGAAATLTVGAFGSDLRYQWYASDPAGSAFAAAGTT